MHYLINITTGFFIFFFAAHGMAAPAELRTSTVSVLKTLYQAIAQNKLPGGCISEMEMATGAAYEFWFRIRDKTALTTVSIYVDSTIHNATAIAELDRRTNRIVYFVAIDQNGPLVCH